LGDLLEDYIQTVVKHYGNDVYCWDVVNEAIADDASGFKPNIWKDNVPNYVDVAFKAAKAAAPDGVKLFYNDYNIASASSWSKKKSDAVFDMIKGMKSRGVPIDGVGLQLHVSETSDQDSWFEGVSSNIQRYKDLGIEVHFTELDIKTPDKNFTRQANFYGKLLQICLNYSNCRSFETWGYTDKYTWLGTDQYPLIYDTEFKPKPAVSSLLSAFNAT